MFTKAFSASLAASAMGNPGVIANPVNWTAGLFEHHPDVPNPTPGKHVWYRRGVITTAPGISHARDVSAAGADWRDRTVVTVPTIGIARMRMLRRRLRRSTSAQGRPCGREWR
jgi:hypothetical protein